MRWIERPTSLVLVGIVATVCFGIIPSNAEAHLSFDPYLWSDSDRSDPINIVYKDGGEVENATADAEGHMGWHEVPYIDQPEFIDHGVRETPFEEIGSGCASGTCNRDHMRLNEGGVNGGDWGGSAWGYWTMAPVHEEIWSWSCLSHYSVSYDGARDWVIYITMQSGLHNTQWWNLNNSEPISQGCGAQSVQGDGYFRWLDV